jgi:hypothetical protein
MKRHLLRIVYSVGMLTTLAFVLEAARKWSAGH